MQESLHFESSLYQGLTWAQMIAVGEGVPTGELVPPGVGTHPAGGRDS